MGFQLDRKSLIELQGVHTDLVAVVKQAIQLTAQEFAVHDGIRTLDEQKKLMETGAARTLESRHITGHAVDLVPIINGKLQWKWGPIYRIADAVRQAAKELGITLRWGGAWDIDFTSSQDHPEKLVSDYAAGRKVVFLDGPHYELPKAKYP